MDAVTSTVSCINGQKEDAEDQEYLNPPHSSQKNEHQNNDTAVAIPEGEDTNLKPADDIVELEDSEKKPKPGLNMFQKYLTVWVLAAMAIGIIIGHYIPAVPDALNAASVADVSIPIAVLLWGIILPMMLQIEFGSVVKVFRNPTPVVVTALVNYAIQPFTMYGIAMLFFKVIFIGYLGYEKANQYLIGSVLLGAAPCTAMVFVWSRLMNGNGAYTLCQVAINDLILLATYVPTVKLLAGSANIYMPWGTLFLSVGFFVVIPLVVGVVTRYTMKRNDKWFAWLNTKLIPLLDSASMIFLVLMVVLLFIQQAPVIVNNLLDILIIAVPLLLQTFLIWAIAYGILYLLKTPYEIAGPASLIACSNFFEMAVAIAISVYGAQSGAALATVVGVLIEVPVMLALVWVNNKTQHLFTHTEHTEFED